MLFVFLRFRVGGEQGKQAFNLVDGLGFRVV